MKHMHDIVSMVKNYSSVKQAWENKHNKSTQMTYTEFYDNICKIIV